MVQITYVAYTKSHHSHEITTVPKIAQLKHNRNRIMYTKLHHSHEITAVSKIAQFKCS